MRPLRIAPLLASFVFLVGAAAHAQDCPKPAPAPPPAAPVPAAPAPPAPLKTAVSVTLDPSTVWQPRGGQVRFIVESKTQPLTGISVIACIRWAGVPDASVFPADVRLVEATSSSNSGKAIFEATVPEELTRLPSSWFDRLAGELFPDRPRVPGRFDSIMSVPIADLRVIVGGVDPPANIVLPVGITSVWAARVITIVCVLAALVILDAMSRRRGVPGSSFVMRLISTRRGYASLSQFQIMLWSFLFGAGAVYVMGLSGSLIDIPTRALVLLGISGATTIGSKIQSANEEARKTAPAAQLPAAATTPPGAVADLKAIDPSDDGMQLTWAAPTGGGAVAAYTVEYQLQGRQEWRLASAAIDAQTTQYRVTGLQPDKTYSFRVFATNGAGNGPASTPVGATTTPPLATTREPRWSDLIVTPVHPGEIDVTRVQMLFFTLISAGFVTIKLFNSYVIPDIPEGFLLLMGISNGVYLTAKFVPDR